LTTLLQIRNTLVETFVAHNSELKQIKHEKWEKVRNGEIFLTN